MSKRRITRAASVPHLPNVQAGASLFSGPSGRWATQALKAAALSGKALTAAALRTADTLRHEEWKFFDDVLVKAAVIRLVGVGDLLNAGLVRPVSNALGKTVFGYEKETDMSPASTSMDGISRTANDRVEFMPGFLPLPITHKDFFINLRTLSASREKGESLDTTQVGLAGRVVAEQLEKMLFQGGPTFSGMPIYGYMTAPNRVTSVSFESGKDWGDSTKTAAGYLTDLLAAISALKANRMFGPYWVYAPADAEVNLEKDYVPTGGTNSTGTIRARLSQVSSVAKLSIADQLPSGNLIVVQATPDVVSWVQGETLQTVQWDEYGGFEINFKAFAIGAPLIRADYSGKSGVCQING
jgi:uncharacterized linocin/CFP29 family protein